MDGLHLKFTAREKALQTRAFPEEHAISPNNKITFRFGAPIADNGPVQQIWLDCRITE